MTRTLAMKYYYIFLFFLIGFSAPSIQAQNTIWVEDFDDGGGGRWTLENAPGSLTNPTPTGIIGLTYGNNAVVSHDNFVINDRNTPELNNNISIGASITTQGQLVRGRHYDCSAPSNLPNPFINAAQPGPNQSLHITAYSTCATLLYAGTPQSDDWNCISDPDNGDVQTETEQIAYLNNNIDASGACNLVLTADFFLGGDSDGIKAHGTILYSVDAGITWQILEDNLSSCSHFLAGTCNNWFRRSFPFPADANYQNDLRIAFRWFDDGDIDNTGDYALGASFNVDNVIITKCDPPAANFTVDHTAGCKNETFVFTDQSVVADGYYTNCTSLLTGMCDITSWAWSISPATFNYVNGTNANSENPEVEFTANGNYSITLISSSCGGGGTHVENNLIIIDDCPPNANFISTQYSACAIPSADQDTVSFLDLSSTPSTPITTWSWSFIPATVTYRNGTNSSSQNIDVTFDAIGTYQIELTVSNSEGSDTETKIAYIEAIDCNCGGGGVVGSVTVFEEDFDGNGGTGSNWTNSPLNNTIGAQGDQPNVWYISDSENGNSAGQCGSAGSGDQSLHVGSTSLGDLGAAYDAGGLCGIFWCVDSDVRSFSNNISTVGVTGLVLNFNYLEEGEGIDDNAIVEYSTNGGGAWTTLVDTPKPGLGGCAPQGLWTAYSIPLPVSCEGISNLRVAYRWMNNDNGSGSDPSFAVDDITIVGTGTGAGPANTWEGDVSSVWSVGGNWSSGVVPNSTTDVLVPATVCGACQMPQINAAATARDVCNFGVITINNDNTLTIDRDLLNEGEITTTTTLQPPDVIFANTPSIYKGSGTLYDVDISLGSSDLTLETNMRPRSMDISTPGTFDMDVYTLSVNRDLSKSAGVFLAINGVVEFVDACVACLDQSNVTDVTINVDQIFGDMLVNKSPGIKASFQSGFNYTLNTPKTLTIQNGVLDANTFTLNGTGNLTMTGGELQLAKCATVLPELTGVYNLPAGKIRFDGLCAQTVKQTSIVGTDYFKVQFDGVGVKTLAGNTIVSDSLLFTLPTGLGSYINAGLDTLFVSNNNAGIVSHTGGHVLGHYNRAYTPSGGVYTFHIGSDNSDGETYFEPLRFTPNVLTGNSQVTARFLDLTPNPTFVLPNIIFGFPFAPDTVEQVETEGYWHMSVKNSVLGGNYTASVSPDVTYWTFAQPWGTGSHTLLKQDIEGDAWDYTAGGARVDDSTTMTFSDFSNYALAFTKNGPLNPLAVELIGFIANCSETKVQFSWATATEQNSHSFRIEQSFDGSSFDIVAVVPAAGMSSQPIQYTYELDRTIEAYYRLSERDMNGVINNHGTVHVDCENENSFSVDIYPNPSTGIVNLNVFTEKVGEGEMRILNMTGEEVYLSEFDIVSGFNLSTHHLNLSSGIYLVLVEVGDQKKVVRFNLID